MASAPQTDERGFVIDPDHIARQRFIDEREKVRLLKVQAETLLAEYDRIIGSAGYPAANNAFDREYAALARAGYGVWKADELHEIGGAYDPDWADPEISTVLCIDERLGTSRSYRERV